MDTLNFIAELVKGGAWPLVVLVIVLIFRGELRKLLSRVRKGKVGSAEFDFEKEMEALAETAPSVPFAPPPPEKVERAVENPRASILEAWVRLEKTARHLAFEHHLFEPGQGQNISLIARSLAKSGLVTGEDLALFNELRNARNYAVHELSFSPSAESVLNYTKLASELEERLRNVTVIR